MGSPVDALLQSVRQSVRAGDAESAFRELGEFVRFVNGSPARWGRVTGSRELDGLCVELAGEVKRRPLPAADPASEESGHLPQVYVTSGLFPGGGHSEWIRELAGCQPDRHHVVLVTDLHGTADREGIGDDWRRENVSLRWADPGTTWLERAQWVAAQLTMFRHGRVFLVTHQEDAPALAGALAAAPGRLHFCHHADYTLALGVYLPGAVHIDVTPYSWRRCREDPGVVGNAFLPLVSPEVPARPAGDFQWGTGEEEFTTGSAGGARKFEFPYDFSYAEIVPEMLARTKGRHVHLGPLSPGFLERIRSGCMRLGVAPERFVHVSHADGLDDALRRHRVGLYLGSFPIGGAKSTVEVMAGGTPVIGHVNYGHPQFGCQDLLYPEAAVWSEPDELYAALDPLDPLTLWKQSQYARRHWERRHRPGLLADLLAAPSLSGEFHPPPPVPAPQNPLRRELESWDGADEWESRRGDDARIAELARELDAVRAELADSVRRETSAAADLARIRGSAAWRAVAWMFGEGTGDEAVRRRD